MTMTGWIFLGVSWGLIIMLGAFCFWKVFKAKKA